MKYIVITSKHHDGFALFKSQASRYNVVDATPFRRDVLKELADAAAPQGIRLGFYYSQSQDWHEPNGAGNDWDFQADGTTPQPSQDILRTVGRWLRVNGEAVYGAGPTPFGEELGDPERARCERRPRQAARLSADAVARDDEAGPALLHVLDEPRTRFAIPAMKNTIRRTYRLADKAPVASKTENGRTLLDIERPILDPMATVIVVEFDGTTIDRNKS